MPSKKFINLQQKRGTGEIIQDTFTFLRLEFRPLILAVLSIVGPYILLLMAAFGFYLYSFGDFTVALEGGSFDTGSYSAVVLGVSYLGILLFSLIAYGLTQSAILHYINLYQEKRNTPDPRDLRKRAYGSFWPIVGLSIIVGVVTFIGLMLCLIPGIYLMVPLLLAFPLMIFRNRSVGEAFSESFGLIRGNWWRSFGLIVLLYLIVIIGSMIMFVPTLVYQFILELSTSSLGDVQSSAMQDPVYIVLNLLSVGVRYLFTVILLIGSCLLYFDLDERERGTGALNEIQGLGTSPDMS